MIKYTNNQLLLFLIFLTFIQCQNSTKNTTNINEKLFSELIDVNKIKKVTIDNNYGKINLNNNQLRKIKSEFSNMKYYPGSPIKPGAIYISILFNNDTSIYGYSSTGSNYVFFDNDIPFKNESLKPSGDIYFEMPKGMNLDNYKN